jgi:hypothetical protein
MDFIRRGEDNVFMDVSYSLPAAGAFQLFGQLL